MVKRRSIQVIKSRLEDINVGDVVNRNPDADQGWFTVHAISTLFNGHLQLADETEQLTVSATNVDMVGVQLVEEVPLDDSGNVIPATTPMMASAMPGLATEAPALMVQHGRDQTAPDPQVSEVSAENGEAEVVDLAAEAAAAAAIATEMDDSPVGTQGRAVPGVDLALVASLLEGLDVGDAPVIDTVLSDEPMRPESTLLIPANAVAVDGGELPDKPSYKNPIVVPEGGMLPRRSRAA